MERNFGISEDQLKEMGLGEPQEEFNLEEEEDEDIQYIYNPKTGSFDIIQNNN